MKRTKFKQSTLGLLGFAFIATGTYNSLVVNSDAFMDTEGVRFIKRLDELNGVTTSGRQLANFGSGGIIKIKSLPSPMEGQKDLVNSAVAATPAETTPVNEPAPEGIAEAAIKEELNLDLAEVFNAKLYAQGLKPSEFSGSLSTNDGMIESISVSLPGNKTLDLSQEVMSGNVFQYDCKKIDENGLEQDATCSGLIFSMDKSNYMVTLTEGTLEGTRLKFSAKTEADNLGNNSEVVAENNFTEPAIQAEQAEQAELPVYGAVTNDDGTQMPVGEFGVDAAPMQAPEKTDVAQNEIPAPEGGYGFNFETQNL